MTSPAFFAFACRNHERFAEIEQVEHFRSAHQFVGIGYRHFLIDFFSQVADIFDTCRQQRIGAQAVRAAVRVFGHDLLESEVRFLP